MRFVVITKVPNPDEGEGGNLAAAGPFYQEDPKDLLKCRDIDPQLAISIMINLRAAVFALGEIVIVGDADDRELVGHCRKPSKWFVETEIFDDIEKAVARAEEFRGW